MRLPWMQPLVDVRRALRPSARLTASGLMVSAPEFGCDGDPAPVAGLVARSELLELLLTPGLDCDGLLARYLPSATAPMLEWADFTHLAGQASLARDLLAASVRKQRSGVNILFYGPTGTGKTEFARVLAHQMGMRLSSAGTADESGESPNARTRLSSLLLGQRLIGAGQGLILFDEMEDLFQSEPHAPHDHAGPLMSKQWLNHLLEHNAIPTIWITNSTEFIDPAFLRRFSYAIEFPKPRATQRTRMFERHIGAGGVSLADIQKLASRHEVSPAQIGASVEAARTLSQNGVLDASVIGQLLAPIEKLVNGIDPSGRQLFDPARYTLDALNSSMDLAVLADRRSRWQRSESGPGLSVCLFGPPGTGKSEYVRYLAHRMGRPVVSRRASEILDMFVGGTEKRIAEAFREAEDSDAVLVFDEVDSFLRDRRHARHSWEVVQVNELLQQLETFRGVVACTTNLWRELDEAVLRRFVFKIELRSLNVDQSMALFRAMVERAGADLTETDDVAVRPVMERLKNLTPGDFAAVERKWQALRQQASSPMELATLLAEEVKHKRNTHRNIGFV